MTANYKLDSMFELRKYLWQELLSNNIFDDSEYYSDNLGEVLNPIIPVQQSAEMNQFLSGKKHIVYDKIGISYDEMWAICTEQILFTVYSTEVMDIVEIKNFMVDLFRRMDESAQDVNRWSGLSDKFKFHSIYISDMSPTSPSEQMKGFLSSDIVLEVKYSRVISPNGRFA
jgi:hypothetical protein